MPMHALVTIIAAAGVATALAVQPPVVMPKLTPTESRELYVAAGFKPVIGGMVSTICNRPAMPRITFVDLNGDGKAEAVAIDKNAACYGEPGDWFTVLRRGSNGKWQVVLRNVGVLVWEPTHTNGWMDARLTGGGQCDRLAHFDGSVYRQTSDCVAPAGSQPASVAPPTGHGVMPPAAPAGGGVRPPSAPHATAPVPAAATPPAPPPAPVAAPASAPGANGITVGERAAIFKAAGFMQRGADWVGCEGQSTASIEQNAVYNEIVSEVRRRVFAPKNIQVELGDRYAYHLKLKERRLDRWKLHVHYLSWYLRIIIKPNRMDREVLRLRRRGRGRYGNQRRTHL